MKIYVQFNSCKESTITLIPTVVYQHLDWGAIWQDGRAHIKHTFFFKFLKYAGGITINIEK